MNIRRLLLCSFILFIGCFLPLSNVFAQNAVLYLSPATGSFTQGQSFWIDIMVDTRGENVNAVAAYFSYPENLLEPIGVNTMDSAINFLAEKSLEAGRGEISGGTPTPGFRGIQKIASAGFRVKASSGTVTLAFHHDSAVLKDSNNQNILNLPGSGKGVYTFQIKSSLPSPPLPLPPSQPQFFPSPPTSPPQQIPQPSVQPTLQISDPLVISDVKVEREGKDSIRISWTTNRAADSFVQHGMNTPHEFSVFDGELTIFHEILLENLPSWQTIDYYVQIVSKDEEHREAQTENLRLSEILTESSGLEQKQPTESGPNRVVSKLPLPLLILLGVLAVLIFLILLFLVIKKLREG